MFEILTTLKPFAALILLCWLWSAFEPVQNPIQSTFKGKTVVGLWIGRLLSCWYCLTLWTGLVWFGLDKWFEVLVCCFVSFVADVTLDRWQRMR